MPATYSNSLTLMDVASQKNPDGRLAKIAEILSEYNPILWDIPFVEGNTETGNIITRRASLGEATWRGLNEGVPVSVSHVSQLTETCGMLETYLEVDKRLVEMSGDVGTFMLNQAKGKMEGMSQIMAQTFMYGNNKLLPRTFLGFMPRLSKINTTQRNGQPIVLDAGGTGSNLSSILLVAWGEDKIAGIYPKYGKSGLQYEDLGQQTLTDASGGRYEGYRQHWMWEAGLCVYDYRYVIRIANIDTSSVAYDEASAKKIYNLMIDAFSYIPAAGGASLTAYAPRTVWAHLSKLSNADVNRSQVVPVNESSRLISNIAGVPFRMCDCMLETESKIS